MPMISGWKIIKDRDAQSASFESLTYEMGDDDRVDAAINTASVFSRVAKCPVKIESSTGEPLINGIEIVVKPEDDPVAVFQDYKSKFLLQATFK